MGLPLLLPVGSAVTVPARCTLSSSGEVRAGQATELCGTCPALAGGRCLHQRLDPLPASEHGIGHVVTQEHRELCRVLLCQKNRQGRKTRHPPHYTIRPARRHLIAELRRLLDQHGTVIVPWGGGEPSKRLGALTGAMAVAVLRLEGRGGG